MNMMDETGQFQFQGVLEGARTVTCYLLRPQGKKFVAIPAGIALIMFHDTESVGAGGAHGRGRENADEDKANVFERTNTIRTSPSEKKLGNKIDSSLCQVANYYGDIVNDFTHYQSFLQELREVKRQEQIVLEGAGQTKEIRGDNRREKS
ncbi:hypothetical protein Tco_0436797 [Tanacetum coccineum]